MGLAPDGGLFVPERIPQGDMARVEYLAGRSYADMAAYLASEIMDDMDPEMLRKAVHEAYDFPIVLRHLDGKLYTLELFHGPTFAFKDFGARFMGRVAAMLNGGRGLTVLAATSGDTGSAVAHGFSGVPGVRVVILYPEGKVSPLQEAQMTTLGGNIYPLRVDGTFDDCQRLVKEMFCDETLRRSVRITSANSINLLRWLPQSFYYFYGWAAWRRITGRTHPDVVVPSGNYGNLAAGVLAQRMGASYRQLYVPDSVSEEILNSILAEDTGVKAVVDIIKQADILVHGVGQAAVMARHRRMAPEFIQKLLDDGAVGEAFGQYCALDGRQVYMTNNAGLMLQDLPKIGTVIGVAGGRSKAEAILSVIRASRQDILVTDEAAAHCIAEMLED